MSCCATGVQSPGSGRIDIECNSSSCCDFNPTNTLQRSMPAVMDGHMTSHQWTTFCDEIDESLKPVNKAARCTRVFSFVTLAAFGCVFLFMFASIGRAMTGGVTSNMSSLFISFFVAFAVIIVGSCVTRSYTISRREETIAEMNRVCEDTSRLHPGLSFHSRKDTQLYGSGRRLRARMYYYLEVSVATSTSNGPSAPISLAYTPETLAVGLAVPGSQNKTPAQRMEELDTMRQFLSQEEYDRKKAEIVASV
mmetsp:Transcript_35203/g.84089  ORF Transcript_35203/g.84089 Transcript_35203/m.84089 type:complete len:251 (+) Transcript_35203:290-1042(+)